MTSRSINLPASKNFEFRLRPELKHVLILVLAAAATMAPTLIWGIPSNRDLSNHFRFALPFYESLRAGDFYPGWMAEANNGFGDASFRFYPPALYYLLAFFRVIASNWYAATVLTFATLSAVGAVGVYLWAKEYASSQTAVLAGVFFLMAPYHLNQFFQATLLAEFAGAAVLPFAFAFTSRVCREGGYRNTGGLAAAYALLIFTHLPLAVIGSIGIGLYAVMCVDWAKRRTSLTQLTCSLAIGLAASASYWVTMVSELAWIRADNVNPEPSVDYRKNFIFSTFSPDYLNVWWMNILLLCTTAMFWPAIVLFWKSRRSVNSEGGSPRKSIKGLVVLLLLTLFMATPPSKPVWVLLRPLQQTQFPWRWLAVTSMICPILLALATPFWLGVAKAKKRPLALLAFGTILMSLAFSGFHIVREATWLTPSEFQQTLDNIPGSPSVYQWLPVWVREPVPVMGEKVQVENRRIAIKRWEPGRRIFQVEAGDATRARVQTFFYPHWKATAAGRELVVQHDEAGVLTIVLPKESVDVTLEFREPKRSQAAGTLSFLGWGLIAGLSLRRHRA
jgi:hypothetical protein